MEIIEQKGEFGVRHERALEEAFTLQLTEQVIASVERLKLKTVPKNYDTTRVRAAIQELKGAVAEGDEDAAMLAEFRLMQELQLWRLAIAQRDSRVSAEQLRRFCEEGSEPLTLQTLAALGRFYRNQMPSFEIRSKYDFVVTRMFAVRDETNRRVLRCERGELISHLAALGYEWTGLSAHASVEENAQYRRGEAVATFEVLIEEIQTYEELERLLKSEFFNRLRRLKQYLGDDFFAPEVTAASIECNIAVGNKFAELLNKGNKALQTTLQDEFGSVEMWDASLIENPNRTMQLLNRIAPGAFSSEKPSAAPNEVEAYGLLVSDEDVKETVKTAPVELENEAATDFTESDLPEALEPFKFDSDEIDTAGHEEEIEYVLKSETADDAPETELENSHIEEESFSQNETHVSVQESKNAPEKAVSAPEFSIVLAELAKPVPNEKVLRDYLAASASAENQNLELAPFFQSSSDVEHSVADDELRRLAFRLVCSSENSLRQVNDNLLEQSQISEINTLIEEMQKVGNNLRLTISSITGENKHERTDALLYVSNILLKSRLRLNSLIARNNANLEASQPLKPQSKTKHRQIEANGRYASQKNVKNAKNAAEDQDAENSSRKPNQWLIAATVLAACIGIIAFIAFPYRESDEVGASADVKVVEARRLNGGEFLVDAKINSQMLIGVVSDKWKPLAEEKKKEHLKQLFGYAAEHQFKSVLLMNSRGEVVATASENQIVTRTN